MPFFFSEKKRSCELKGELRRARTAPGPLSCRLTLGKNVLELSSPKGYAVSTFSTLECGRIWRHIAEHAIT